MDVYLLAVTVLLPALLARLCRRGARIPGQSWFDVVHEMHGTSKKATGRIQQRPKPRKSRHA